jgi:long-chain acyl-CoA synthetase
MAELAGRADRKGDQMRDVVAKLVSEIFDVDPSELDEQIEFPSLEGWDSLNHMEFIVRLETELGINLTGDDIAEMRSLAATYTILEPKLNR